MTTSSIHFKRVDPFFCEKHNSRNTEKQPTYLLDTDLRKSNDFVKLADISVLHNEQLEIRKTNRCRGKAPELRDSCWEAVINLEEHHTLADVKQVADFIHKEYHLTPISIAIHRDEGYVDSDGQVKYNYHAHIPFYTVSEGKSVMRTISRKQLSEMQTEVADLLGMQRGQINSTAKRLEQSEYRRLARAEQEHNQELAEVKQKQKQAEAVLEQVQPALQRSVEEKKQLNSTAKRLNNKVFTLKAQKAIVGAERKKYIKEANHNAEEYRKLQALNKTLYTKEQLESELQKLRDEHARRLKAVKATQKAKLKIQKARLNTVTQQRDNLLKFNSTVLQVIQAMYSDFDLEHPIQSLKKIYSAWKNSTQKSQTTAPKLSQCDETTPKRVEVQQTPQSQPMMSVEQKTTTEEKRYRIMFGDFECFMTAQEINGWIDDYPEEEDAIKKQLSEADRAEVFPSPAPTKFNGFHR